MADDIKTEEKKKKNLDPASKLPATSLIDEQRKNKIMRQFELQVFDEDLNDDGTTRLKPVKMERAIIVEASTPEELKTILAQYRLCGQVAKIVREINPPPHPISEPTMPQAQLPAPQCQPQTMPAALASISNLPTAPAAAPKLKPKIVTIGDMQVKYDGDKVYQKQWVKLNANEAANFRVVSDSSNKIVSMAGKHIEAKRWIRVEETPNDNVDDTVESILAGN